MDKVIFYGAGKKADYDFSLSERLGFSNEIACFCTTGDPNIQIKNGKSVVGFAIANNMRMPFVICVSKKTAAYNEIETILKQNHCSFYKDVSDWLVYGHNIERFVVGREMEALTCDGSKYGGAYYSKAESNEWLAPFWNEGSVFRNKFNQLDLSNVIELACGFGRHLTKYYQFAGAITLVDYSQENIDYCKERFHDKSNIFYYRNNGIDLKDLKSNSYSSCFSYDAMHQFEMMDVYGYLKEMYRVLVRGGAYINPSFEYAL